MGLLPLEGSFTANAGPWRPHFAEFTVGAPPRRSTQAATATCSRMVDTERLLAAYQTARRDLLAQRVPEGHWVGELSSSALSTATAVSALSLVRRHAPAGVSGRSADDEERFSELIFRGIDWLARSQNADGGWGDTDKSLSNIATTMLVRAAFQLTCVPARHAGLLERADAYVAAQGSIEGLRRRYGKDKTFAVPILTNCALAGLTPWSEVSPLPFELACLPQSWYRFLRLPVVSYAIPALVAIGQARYFHRKPLNPLVRAVRAAAVDKSLQVLEQMQPASGGFLEATPLTSFVVMSLASIGQGRHPVTRRGISFLTASARADGSWPIDTNLATWVTTLSLNAISGGEESARDGRAAGSTLHVAPAAADKSPGDTESLAEVGDRCLPWLLSCQEREPHPYTGAAPGGWGWSDLSGSVPDADDTPGALLALAALRKSATEAEQRRQIDESAEAGIRWLLDLQNSDGGWPTFCRGWGKLPFDCSGADLTAHVMRALRAWETIGTQAAEEEAEKAAKSLANQGADAHRSAVPVQIAEAVRRGFAYLQRQQRADGSWIPLWFGNQHHPQEANPIYGTAKVLLAYRDFGRLESPVARRGLAWLAGQQNCDGGWGGVPPSPAKRQCPVSAVEETALALEALLSTTPAAETQAVAEKGLAWLVSAVENGRHGESSPIGFYFAKLWYYETLYPLIFTVAALGQAVACRREQSTQVEVGAKVESAPVAEVWKA